MTSVQKTIKKIAEILAWILAICIIVSIVSSAASLLTFIGLFDSNDSNADGITTVEFSADNISDLFIDIDASKLNIVTEGIGIKVAVNNERVSIRENKGTLKVEEKSRSWFEKSENIEITVYIPENKVFEQVEINAGAGNIAISSLSAKELELDLGAGKTTIDSLMTARETKLNGGTGEFILKDGSLADLELDWGVGDAEISAEILGDTEINTGIGNFTLEIKGSALDYKINTSKGIGDITVDGESLSNKEIYGDGLNEIRINSGIGNVKITFSE